MTRFRLLGAALLAALLVVPAAADAHRLIGKPLKKAIWGPVEIDGVSQFPTYKSLDADIFQIQVSWQRAAPQRPADPTNPADPAYRWPSAVDRAVSEAAANGIRVLILIQGAPGWSNGGNQWYTPPTNPADYADFVTAAARRYPSVRHWMIWGEPIRNMASPDDRSRTENLRLAGVYAQMLDASYVALKRQRRRNIVIGGNTFTTSTEPDWGWVPVYQFMQHLRLPNGKPPRMDMWGHNPFTGRFPRLRDQPEGFEGDVSDLDRVIVNVKRNIAKPLRRRIPLFISEFCLPTGINPWFPVELTLEQQAQWLRRTFRIARNQRKIYGLGWWTLRDGENNGCGLVDASHNPKPAFRVFQRARTLR